MYIPRCYLNEELRWAFCANGWVQDEIVIVVVVVVVVGNGSFSYRFEVIGTVYIPY